MSESVASWLVTAGGVYAVCGLVFAAAFVTRGAGAVDPRARRGSWGFRLAILPGVAALWPLLAGRWVRRRPPPEERNAHRQSAGREAGG